MSYLIQICIIAIDKYTCLILSFNHIEEICFEQGCIKTTTQIIHMRMSSRHVHLRMFKHHTTQWYVW